MTDRALPAGGPSPRPTAARNSRGVVIEPNSDRAPTRISSRRVRPSQFFEPWPMILSMVPTPG